MSDEACKQAELAETSSDVLTMQEAEAILQRMAELQTSTRRLPFARPPSRSGGGTTETRPVSVPALLRAAGAAVLREWDRDTLLAVLESVPDAVVVVAPDGTIALVNRQTEVLFGYSRAELLHHPVELLIPERFRARHVGQRDVYFAAPHLRPMGAGLELYGRRKDGIEFPVEISLSPVQTPGSVLVTSTIRDISERQHAERQLRHAEARYRTLVEGTPGFLAGRSLCARRRAEEIQTRPA